VLDRARFTAVPRPAKVRVRAVLPGRGIGWNEVKLTCFGPPPPCEFLVLPAVISKGAMRTLFAGLGPVNVRRRILLRPFANGFVG
jgi:hypothetical protein